MRKMAILFFLVFSAHLFGAEMIYTWGYGDLLSSTLTAVNFTFAHNDFSGLFKFALLVAFIMATVSSAQLGMKGDMLSLPKLLAMSVGISTLFMVWKIDVVVKDVTKNQNYVVDQVPWAVAKPMIWFSGMEKHLGEIMETSFAVPSDISYSNGGFLSPFGAMSAAGSAKIVDPNLFQSVDNLIVDCVAPDVQSGYFNVTTLNQSEDLWLEFAGVNPARVTYYYKTGATPSLETCVDAYNKITSDLNTYAAGTGMTSLGGMLGGYSATQLTGILGTSSSYFMNYTKSASSFLIQSIMTNQFNQTYSNWATANGVSGSSVAYGVGKGEQTAQANMIISGVLGSKYIPVIKGLLTIILTALTPVVALMMLTPMFWKVLSGYLVTLIWLSLWHIGEVILNFVILTKASSYMQTVSSSNGVYNLVSKPVVDGSMIDYVNMASSNYWMIPTIAGVIVGGFSFMAFQGITGGMTARVARGEGAAMEVGSGTATLGNITMNNARTNQAMWASNSSFGQGTNMNNSFGVNNGLDEKNSNNSATNVMQLGDNTLRGTMKSSSDGNRTMFTSMDAVDNLGRHITSSQFSYNNDGKEWEGQRTVATSDSNGKIHQTTETWQQGQIVKSEDITNGGLKHEQQHYGDGVSEKYSGGGGTIDLQNGNVANANLAEKIKSDMVHSYQSGKQEAIKAEIGQGVTNALAFKDVDAKAASRVSQAVMSKAMESGTTNSQEDLLAKQAVSQAANSLGIDKSKSNKRDFTTIDSGTVTNATSGMVELGAGVTTPIGSVGAKGVQAWTDGKSMVVSDGKGTSYSFGLTEKEQESFSKSVTKGYSEKMQNYYSEKNGYTTSESGSNSSTSSNSREASQTKQISEQIAASLVSSYMKSDSKSIGVDNGQALTNAIVGSFIEDKYKTAAYSGQYGGGKEGMMYALVAADPRATADLEAYAKTYAGIKDPSSVLNSTQANQLGGLGESIPNATKGVMGAGNSAFNQGENLPQNVNTAIANTTASTLSPSQYNAMMAEQNSIVKKVDAGIIPDGSKGVIGQLENQAHLTETGIKHRPGVDVITHAEVHSDPNAAIKSHMGAASPSDKIGAAAYHKAGDLGIIERANGSFTESTLARPDKLNQLNDSEVSSLRNYMTSNDFTHGADAKTMELIDREIARRANQGNGFDLTGGTSSLIETLGNNTSLIKGGSQIEIPERK